jgi:predicted  nucleic acid-binding Zn-ribbon protein
MSKSVNNAYNNEIEILTKRIEKLEEIVDDFMGKWGHGVQEKRKQRDDIWDEMIRVLTIQKRNAD